MKHPVDVHVGARLRRCRDMVGMTQKQLAERVGVKFQQIQKYEAGGNRVSASRMWDIAAALGVSVSYFFEGMDDAPLANGDAVYTMADDTENELMRVYRGIPETQRQKFLDLARLLSQAA